MEAVTLLQRAQEAGLRIELMGGDTLLVRGPKRAEAVVKLLAEHKAEVLAALSPSCVDAGWWRERLTVFRKSRPGWRYREVSASPGSRRCRLIATTSKLRCQ